MDVIILTKAASDDGSVSVHIVGEGNNRNSLNLTMQFPERCKRSQANIVLLTPPTL